MRTVTISVRAELYSLRLGAVLYVIVRDAVGRAEGLVGTETLEVV